jgi:hypothetical protein
MLYPDLTINEKINAMITIKHDDVFFSYNGEWIYSNGVERHVCKSPQELFDVLWDMLTPEWRSYYEACIQHIAYMQTKKAELTNGEWAMQFSIMAPNKPGYTRANND